MSTALIRRRARRASRAAFAAAGARAVELRTAPRLRHAAASLAPPGAPPQSTPRRRIAAAASGHRRPAEHRRRAGAGPGRDRDLPARRPHREARQKCVEASGKVELRTRRETVLADWLAYDFDDRRDPRATATSLLRQGIDWITGPGAAASSATPRPASSTSPRFYVGENGARGDAARDHLRRPGSLRGHRRAATRPASRRARTGSCATRRARARHGAQGRHRARRDGATSSACRCSTRRGSSSRCRTIASPASSTPIMGSSGTRGFEMARAVLPQPRAQLRRDAHAAAHDQARLAARRAVPLPVRDAAADGQGEIDRRVPAATTASPSTTRWLLLVEAQPADHARGSPATSNLNKVSDDTYFADLADRVAITSQIDAAARRRACRRSTGPWRCSRACSASRRCRTRTQPITPPYNRVPQVLVDAAPSRMGGLHALGHRRVRALPPTRCSRRRPRRARIRIVDVATAGPAWFFTARGGVHARALRPPRPGRADGADPPVVRADHEPRRRPRRSSATGARSAAASSRRSSRARSTSTSRTATRRSCRCSTPRIDDFNFSQLFTENRYSATTASATPTSSRSPLTSRLLDPGHRRGAPARRASASASTSRTSA